MKRSIRTAALALACGAALLTPASASALTAPAGDPVPHEAATSEAAQLRVLQYWTPARMQSATPMEQILTGVTGKLKDIARGLPKVVPPTSPLSFPNGGSAWTGGGKVTHTTGRVFFTYQGRTAACSGDAVTSGNKSTVITAGHCVKLDGKWHTNWVFVPGYHNGSRPYGTWTAKKILATSQWAKSEDLNYDVGAGVVNNLSGRRLTNVVGGQGIAFNQARGQNMYAFGYPAASPYDGSKLIYCSGRVINDPLPLIGSNDQGIGCDMTGGSSGGPWFLRFNEKTGAGVQNSVNSFKYNFLPNFMFGPYFGSSAQSLYKKAASS